MSKLHRSRRVFARLSILLLELRQVYAFGQVYVSGKQPQGIPGSSDSSPQRVQAAQKDAEGHTRQSASSPAASQGHPGTDPKQVHSAPPEAQQHTQPCHQGLGVAHQHLAPMERGTDLAVSYFSMFLLFFFCVVKESKVRKI